MTNSEVKNTVEDQPDTEETKKVVKPRKPRTGKTTKPAAEKPPTQGVGVLGFKADIYAADEVKINWPLLMTLPKFQMYCVELSKRHHGEVEMWMTGFLKDQLMQGEKVFFQAYCDWHDAKGYWKQETPYGELIEG